MLLWLVCCLWPAIAWAQTLQVTPSAPDLQERLTGEARVLTLPADATAGDIIATAQGDYGRLLAVLYEEGFFGAEISIRLAGREADGLTALDANIAVRPARIDVTLGPPFRFGRAEVIPLPPEAALPDAFAPGETARTDVIRQAGRDSVDAWRDASHAKAEVVEQNITARHRDAALDVVLRVDPGPALRFGQFVVPQNAEVRAERLKAIGGLPEGDPYSPQALDDVRDRLLQTGAFNSVVIREAETPNPDGTLDIELEVQPAPLRRVGFGAEIETKSGISLEAFWMHRNLYGGAERLRFDFSVEGIGGDTGGVIGSDTGGVDVAIGGRLTIPGFRRPDDTLEIFGTIERLNEVEFTSRFIELGVRRVRQIRGRELEIGNAFSLRFSDTEDAFGSRQFRHLVFQLDATRDLRDDPLDPRAGRYDQLVARPIVGVSDGSGTGVILTGDFRRYRAVRDGTVLAGRVQFGSILGTSLAATPPEFLFFSGGGGTVRGQSYQSLGVDTDDGLVGGRGFLGANVEVRQDITDVIGVVGFVDVGYVSDGGTFEDGGSHAGVGLGVRYRTGLGPLRADIGFPVGGDSDDAFGVFIGIGQAF